MKLLKPSNINRFKWDHYLELNPDLLEIGINTPEKALKHYNREGKRQGRRYVKINDTTLFFTYGRFGNILFVNLVAHYIATINNLKMKYREYDKFIELGISLFSNNDYIIPNIVTKDNLLILDDNNLDDIFSNPELIKNKNLIINGYYQTPVVARYIKSIIILNKENIFKNNKYFSNYNNNNNLFVHVRLGDISNLKCVEKYEYYDKAIGNISFEKGYISSDSINHEIITNLIKKYNLEIFNDNEVNTIHFASTCKNIVLSKGTFSWTIGLIGDVLNNSVIYYPEKINNRVDWHGDIFVFPEWNKIRY
jgi:hypothetical protein